MKNRVVITGLGALSSLGDNIREMENTLMQREVNYEVIPTERFSTDHKLFRNNKGFMMKHSIYKDASEKDPYMMPEITTKCISEALDDSNLSRKDIQNLTTGLCLGTSVGACFAIIQRIKNSIAGKGEDYSLGLFSTPKIIGKVAANFKLSGPVSAISTACASGTNSLGRAYDLIENGRADIMIAGGIDIFTELTYTGFNSLFALSKTKCRPFSNSRDGMSLGDACGILILESLESAQKRGATIYAEIKGYHILNEGYHPTAPHPEGKYALKCMETILLRSKTNVDNVQYINAHGTGTPKNDGAELNACEQILRNKETKTYLGSTKCLTGHTLGAAGSIEAIICVLSLKHNTIFANSETEDLPHSEKVEFITANRSNVSIDNILSNSFGFGGNMASILLSKYSRSHTHS